MKAWLASLRSVTLGLAVVGVAGLVGCRKAPEPAPQELSELAGFLFEHFEDEDTSQLQEALVNLDAWLSVDANFAETAQGYSVNTIAESVLDAVNPGREHDLENLGGAAVAAELAFDVDTIASALVFDEQEEVFPNAYQSHERTYESDKDCFADKSCDFIDTDNRVSVDYTVIALETHSRSQFRWIQMEDGEYALIQRIWLVDEAETDNDDLEIKEQIYSGAVLPRSNGAVRLGTTWVSADITGGGLPVETILTLMVTAMRNEAENLEAYLANE